MQGSSRVSTIGPTHDALPDAYAAAMHVAQLLQPEGPPLSLPEQRAFVDTWATTHLIRCNAPLEVVQDCTQYIHSSLTPTNINAAGLVATAPPQSSTVSTIVCANPFRVRVEEEESSDQTSPSSSSGSGGVDRDGSGANDAAPVALDPTLDVDHCTMKRMLDDEDAQWAMLHESKSPTTSHNGTAPITPALDDVFSPAALQREAWQCWAAVLREVKVEAAVQQLERRSREGGGHREGTHASLDGLLQFLGVPETPWLMEDGPSGVLVAADMYMVDRAYSRDGQEEGDDVQVSADGTHDMRAVHAFLLEQDLEEPPLRSLVSLALASHLEAGN